MPYSGASDPDLPQAVKDLSEDNREKWVSTFNSAHADCMADDEMSADECETSAFAIAYSVVENSIWIDLMKNILDFSKKVDDTFRRIMGLDEERAISIGDVYWQISDALWEGDDFAFLTDLYMDDDQMFGVIAKEGKLYRAEVSVNGSDVTIGELIAVEMEFVPVTQSITIRRTADGSFRWVGISAASVLNRVGEIDSRDLFDSFVEHAEETGEYPIRQFYHAGEQFRTGQCDFMARDGYLLITSGIYDDSELANLEVKSRTKDTEFWGDSIGFVSNQEPDKLQFEDGITIPVYTQGICREISTVPEADAASWMTAMPTLDSMEVIRMLKSKQFDAFVLLFNGDEDKAREWLEDNADSRNRMITEEGKIARSTDPESEDPEVERDAVEEESESPEEVEAEVDADAETEDEDEDEDTEEFVLELDEAATGAIAERVADALGENFSTIEQTIATIAETVETVTTQMEELSERIAAVEADDAQRHTTWIEDLPRTNRLPVTFRPRNQESSDSADEEDEEDEQPEPGSTALDAISQLN